MCGAVAIEASGPVLFRALCHCTICQRWSGAPSTAFVGFAGQQLRVTAGADSLLSHATSPSMTRFRCAKCGCPVYNQSTDPKFDFRDAPITTFERDGAGTIKHLDDLRPVAHIFCADRLPGIAKSDPDGVVKFVGHFGHSEKTEECP